MEKWNKLVLTLLLAFVFSTSYADSVNINQADAKSIAAALNGIGDKKAEAIVMYREQNGSFKAADDLAKIKGIGTKTIEKNRSDILLD